MLAIGRLNVLEVLEKTPQGYYLDGLSLGSILLPNKFAPKTLAIGDSIQVMVAFDSEDRLVATTQKPKLQVGEFGLLRVVDTTSIGAFLDWGMDKDVLLPFSEQKRPVEVGDQVLVRLYLDNASERITASCKLDRFLDKTPPDYQAGEEVELVIANRTDLGIKAVVNNQHWGVIYHNGAAKPIRFGSKVTGYIKRVRDDDKIDLMLTKADGKHIQSLADQILEQLERNGGFLPVNDKSKPDLIKRMFADSKANFKKAIGYLYKNRKITISPDGITKV